MNVRCSSCCQPHGVLCLCGAQPRAQPGTPFTARMQLLQTLSGGKVADKAIIALCGIGKMFVGDMVEMGEWQQRAALRGQRVSLRSPLTCSNSCDPLCARHTCSAPSPIMHRAYQCCNQFHAPPWHCLHAARHMAGLEGHTGPLLPRHIRRAYQQLELVDKGPPRKQPRKRMFK